MSLLSEDKAQVIEATNLNILGQTRLPYKVTTQFSLLSGVYKQAVGYVTPRNEEYTYVLDLITNAPLKLPQGFLPVAAYTVPLQLFNNSSDVYLYFTDTVTNPVNTQDIGGGWIGEDLNTFTYNEIDEQANALTYEGYNYVVMYNNNFPTPITSGISKVIIEYI